MTTIDERIAHERSRALSLRPEWDYDRADAYARAVIERDAAIADLRTALDGLTGSDLYDQSETIMSDNGQGFMSTSFDPGGDAWGLDSGDVDYGAALAERNAADDFAKRLAEYEASDEAIAVNQLRSALKQAGWSEDRIDQTAGARHVNRPERKAAAAPAKAPAKKAETWGEVNAEFARIGEELDALYRKLGD